MSFCTSELWMSVMTYAWTWPLMARVSQAPVRQKGWAKVAEVVEVESHLALAVAKVAVAKVAVAEIAELRADYVRDGFLGP